MGIVKNHGILPQGAITVMPTEENDISAFFALVFRQKHIRRWALMHNTFSETLSEHAAECAILTHALTVIGNVKFNRGYNADRAVELALFHDVPEVYTGDLPTPIKYSDPILREQFLKIEEQSIDALVNKLPEEFRGIYREILLSNGKDDHELHRIVKAADKLCAYIKCIEEEKSGNTEFTSAGISIKDQLEAIDLPELKYFMEHFLPAFMLTLDGQQKL